ncbi:MAG: GTP pyrophosphokinase family protein [Ruminococcus sp.]|nr:GTP pyrophosphokinase family protein [Ruminococcus sp.]
MNETDMLFYGSYAPRLKEITRELLNKVRMILDGISSDTETAPAEHLKARIKSTDSVREKLQLNGYAATAESGLRQLSDIIGLRVVTHFVGDIYTVLEQMQQDPSWRVVLIKDYIANPKPNGYRSLHIILAIPFNCEGIDSIMVEVQLRTIAMDCWASLEHQLKYKKNIKNANLIVDELKRCADEMASTDLTMQTIRDLIQRGN